MPSYPLSVSCFEGKPIYIIKNLFQLSENHLVLCSKIAQMTKLILGKQLLIPKNTYVKIVILGWLYKPTKNNQGDSLC